MSTFVVTASSTDVLQTTVFAAGPTGTEEAVAAFSSQKAAEQYLEEADWGDACVVAELQNADFMLWLAEAFRDGVRYLAINPRREQQMQGRRLTVIEIEPQLAAAAAKIERLMRDDF